MMKIAVAMSGGVDSSVAAALLQQQGHDIFGITMRHFDDAAYGFPAGSGIEASIEDARRVAEVLQIPHHVIDVRQAFHQMVEKDFVEEYRQGRTPNPCTLCNPTIKWGEMLTQAQKRGAEKMATGHYIRLVEQDGQFRIVLADDTAKDQSYMLWRLNQHQLSHTLFPIAELQKSEVRTLAEQYNLPIHAKQDSQEICFIHGHYEDYLRKHLSLKSGDIVLKGGRVIGKHRGLPLYTIGQRKGLNTPWHAPLYVLRLDARHNRVIVTDNPDDLLQQTFALNSINWISGAMPDSAGLSVQIRYNSSPVPLASIQQKKHITLVTLQQPTRAITPGQSAVFYRDDELLGGGIIC
jgi:tRNA-specific 2-thiouridylase